MNCPGCGGKYRKKSGNIFWWTRGRKYLVRGVKYRECTKCKQRIFGPDACRKIEERLNKEAT